MTGNNENHPLTTTIQRLIVPFRLPVRSPVPPPLAPPTHMSSGSRYNPIPTQMPPQLSPAHGPTPASPESTPPPRHTSDIIAAFHELRPMMECRRSILLESNSAQPLESPPPPPVRMRNIPLPDTRLRDWRTRAEELKEENTMLERALNLSAKPGKFATRQRERNDGKIEIYEGKIQALEIEIREAAEGRKFGSSRC